MKTNRVLNRDKCRGWIRWSLVIGCILFSSMRIYASDVRLVNDSIKLDLKFEKSTMLEVLNTLKKKTALNFVYNHEEIKGIPLITKEFRQATVHQILDYCLRNTGYVFSVVNDVVVIKKKEVKRGQQKVTITGTVFDEKNEPLPGATVMLKGTTIGVASDVNGEFKLELPESDGMVLVVNFIGMVSQEIPVTRDVNLKIVLKMADTALDDVVVNGFYTKNKNTFTGSVTTVKGEELVQASSTNLIQALSTLVPGLRIVENNAQGSNPNAVPEIIIRGTNSLMTSDEAGINTPLIILDGIEISLEELYDLDLFDIESVNVLKDAAATVLYGERASNGVIVVERAHVKDDKVRFSYNFVPDFSFPDLSSMNLCNASEKLELERRAGLYNSANGNADRNYAYKLENVRKGIDTDWISKPLRNSFSHSHSLRVAGRGGNMDYKASASFKDTYGVMKGDYRRNYGLNFSLAYHMTNKLTISYQFAFGMTDSKDSPYGQFSTYTELNPYEPVYDEDGEYIRNYYFNKFDPSRNEKIENPLYNATLSSFSKSKSKSIKNSLSLRWDISKSFFVNGQFDLNLSDSKSDKYTSPENSAYENYTSPEELAQKGEYRQSSSDGNSYTGKLVANYSIALDELGSVFGIHAGTEISREKTTSSQITAVGFLKDELDDLSYAMKYDDKAPSGSEKLSTRVGFFGDVDLSYRNRYFVNGVFRTSGSSKFGKNQRFAPFWSVGFGWNVHNEEFLKCDWLNTLRFRVSYGYTGNAGFSPYQAITTYKYSNDYRYYAGVGALPITMGNMDLKWQRTLKMNYGVTGGFLNDRLRVEFDYYVEKTKDMLIPIDVPLSMGVDNVKVNLGSAKNAGLDFSISGQIIQKKDWSWMLTVNGGHVYDKIEKISNALQRTNSETTSSDEWNAPKIQFKEGESQYAIYAMRSAGIDPATGKEVYINKNGEYTFDYSYDDQVVVGNTNPTIQGSIFTSFRYKGFSLSVSAAYTLGGDIYNTTLAKKVENINIKENVDRRAFTERWKEIGDETRFLGIPESGWATYLSERFVERKNELSISNINLQYEFNVEKLKLFGLKRLVVGIGASDIGRLSTVKFERGTSYPYCRSFNFILRPTF